MGTSPSTIDESVITTNTGDIATNVTNIASNTTRIALLDTDTASGTLNVQTANIGSVAWMCRPPRAQTGCH
ncbi:MAG: hypothetical protein E2O62_04885 [Gammaproteobacteria bacterium]|nr:MAG: hypothetical protein E2O62_04885 [Gammaproteobacteria bacterium]